MDRYITLDSEKGTLAFVHLLIKFRDSLQENAHLHENIFEEINKLLAKKSVFTNTGALRGARTKFRERLRRRAGEGKRPDELDTVCSVIFDKADLKLIKGTKYDPASDSAHFLEDSLDDQDVDALAKYNAGNIQLNSQITDFH